MVYFVQFNCGAKKWCYFRVFVRPNIMKAGNCEKSTEKAIISLKI